MATWVGRCLNKVSCLQAASPILPCPLNRSTIQICLNILLLCPLNCSTNHTCFNRGINDKQTDRLCILTYRGTSLDTVSKIALSVQAYRMVQSRKDLDFTQQRLLGLDKTMFDKLAKIKTLYIQKWWLQILTGLKHATIILLTTSKPKIVIPACN